MRQYIKYLWTSWKPIRCKQWGKRSYIEGFDELYWKTSLETAYGMMVNGYYICGIGFFESALRLHIMQVT